MRVLWFSNTPGLAKDQLKGRYLGGGWIDSLQAEVEKLDGCELGFVCYADQNMRDFNYGKTSYFPVQRRLNTKLKRYWAKIIAKVEYDENVDKFLAIISTFKPDIIHIHGTESSFGLIIPRITVIPVIISIQGNLTVYTQKYFSGIKYTSVNKGLTTFLNKTILDYRSFKKRAAIESEILASAKYIAGRTDWDRRITSILSPNSKYFLLDEVMRSNFYARKWSSKETEIKTLFTISSNSLYKGFEVIVETALLLKKNNYAFEWFVAGLSLRDELVRFSMQLHSVSSLENIGIRLMGTISPEAFLDKMLSADMYVQVSHIENSPNSLCEAMLLGMPIIASNVGGTSSLIKDKETGILIQDGDPIALAGAIVELSNQNEFAIALGNAASLVAHERHSQKKIVKKLIDTYSEIINLHKSMISVSN
jgi:glycosyltransferase involved in cell wall biosynthesis